MHKSKKRKGDFLKFKKIVLIVGIVYLLFNCLFIFQLKNQLDDLNKNYQLAKDEIISLKDNLTNNTETINKLNKTIENLKS